MKLVPIEFLALLCTALCCLHPLGWASPSSTSVRDGCIWWLKIFTIVCLRMTRKLSIGLRVTNQFYYVSEFGNTEYNEDWLFSMEAQGFPCGSAGKESACKKESTCNVGRPGFDPWVGKIPWRREQLPTSVFWPGELSWSDFHMDLKNKENSLGNKSELILSQWSCEIKFYSTFHGQCWPQSMSKNKPTRSTEIIDRIRR